MDDPLPDMLKVMGDRLFALRRSTDEQIVELAEAALIAVNDLYFYTLELNKQPKDS